MANKAYERLSAITGGHDVLMTIRLSVLMTLVDQSLLPSKVTDSIISSVEKQIKAKVRDDAAEL